MMNRARKLVTITVLMLSCSVPASAQRQQPATRPATAAAEETDVVGNPITFLLARLASVEQSIQAIDLELRKTNSQIRTRTGQAADHEKGNELMNRKGGAPVPWEEFYGKTASDFYKRNSFDRQVSVRTGAGTLDAQSSARWGKLQLVKRPPQMDYIYKANTDQANRAKTEAAALSGKADKLVARKRELETQQSALWARIAAAMIGECAMGDRPLYLFEISPTSGADATGLPGSADQRRTAIAATVQFLRVVGEAAEQLAQYAAKDQTAALEALKQNLSKADEALARQFATIGTLAQDNQVASLRTGAKRLTTVAASAFEATTATADAAKAEDEIQKQANRGLLQDAIAQIAEQTTSLDDAVIDLADAWMIKPASERPLPEVELVQPVIKAVQSNGDSDSASASIAEPSDLREVIKRITNSRAKLMEISTQGGGLQRDLALLRGVSPSEAAAEAGGGRRGAGGRGPGGGGRRNGGTPPAERYPTSMYELADALTKAAELSDTTQRQQAVRSAAKDFTAVRKSFRGFWNSFRERMNAEDKTRCRQAIGTFESAVTLFEYASGLTLEP